MRMRLYKAHLSSTVVTHQDDMIAGTVKKRLMDITRSLALRPGGMAISFMPGGGLIILRGAAVHRRVPACCEIGEHHPLPLQIAVPASYQGVLVALHRQG